MPDDFLDGAKPASPNADFLAGAVPTTPASAALPVDTRNDVQKGFDELTKIEPANTRPGVMGHIATGLGNFGGGVMGLAAPLVHPVQTAKSLANTMMLPDVQSGNVPKLFPDTPTIPEGMIKGFKQNPSGMAENLLGGLVGGGVVGEGLDALKPAISDVASNIRSASLGDPNAAALRALQVGPKSPNALGTIRSVEGARPYFQGAQNLQEAQSMLPGAKAEIWNPYKTAVNAIGGREVLGPDGLTTVADLENERLQLSALNRGLKQKNPEAIQLAQQKGMTQAELLQREKDVASTLDPELQSTGINPQLIRQTFGNVAQVGNRMSGKSTLIEKPQPTGFGNIANLSIKNPLQAPGTIATGLRDLLAGRNLWSDKPTDMGIREAFRTAGPKPEFGTPQPPNLTARAPLGLPAHAPIMGTPLSSYPEIFPNQLPAGFRIPRTIEGIK